VIEGTNSINFLAPVEALLLDVEALIRTQAEGHHPDLDAALAFLFDSGGKRVRPALALLSGGMLGGEPDRLVTLAAAIEMLHTATLVHDDLIDGAMIRRGASTINARWSPAATVLTGDFVFARAAKLAAETDSVAVMRLFAETLATIVSGEITQLFSSPGVASRQNYEQRIYAKTASLFELATAAAAILCRVDDDLVEAMRCYGNSIGMAFQIVDDILDFTGDQVKVGKPVASDLRQGLITLPALYYFEQFPDDPDLQAVLQGSTNNGLIERVVAGIRASGAIQQALQEANDFVQRGIEILEEMPISVERQALYDLGDYIVCRDF
jgi:geranylgeranyl pyrophosphate synthase